MEDHLKLRVQSLEQKNCQGRIQEFVQEGDNFFSFEGVYSAGLGPKTIDFTDPGGAEPPIAPLNTPRKSVLADQPINHGWIPIN